MRYKSYSVYIFFKFCFSLIFSMATVLSLVYHLEIVGLNAFELVLVGTVLETSCFLLEIPTGIVADLYSRRLSVLIGVFLYGFGFLLEGAIPWLTTVLIAQVVWGCGDTFISGALEAWIASEEKNSSIDKIFLKGSQISQLGGILGIIIGTLLGNLDLRLPIIIAGLLALVLGIVLIFIMPETNFSPVQEKKGSIFLDMIGLFKINFSFIKGTPVLITLLAIAFCGGLASEGFDRLSTAHFLNDSIIPSFLGLNSVTWFGVMSLLGSLLGILCSQILIVYLEKRNTINRTSIVLFANAGYIISLILFALGRNFWFMLSVFLITGLMRNLKEPILAAWMNEHIEDGLQATVFSTNGQLDSFGQIIGGPLVGIVAQQFSISYGLVFTALLLLPTLFLLPLAGKIKKG